MRAFAQTYLALAMLALSGCISIGDVKQAAREAMQRCAVESEPPGATVRINGQRVGTTPCEVPRPFGNAGRKGYHFAASHEGYETAILEYRDFPTFVQFELNPIPAELEPAAYAIECDLDALPTLDEPRSVAVLDFQVSGDVDRNVGETLADFCRETIQHSRRLILVDRNNMRAILSESDFAATFECDDTKCLVDFGRKLRAQYIVHGRTTRVGRMRVLTLKMIDVSTGAIVAVRNVKAGGSLERLLDLAGPATCALLREGLPAEPTQPQTPELTANP